jgi:hypothetical protein
VGVALPLKLPLACSPRLPPRIASIPRSLTPLFASYSQSDMTSQPTLRGLVVLNA